PAHALPRLAASTVATCSPPYTLSWPRLESATSAGKSSRNAAGLETKVRRNESSVPQTSSKAVVFTGPQMVEVREVAVPTPGRDEVQIETMFSGISAGTEMNVYRVRAPQWKVRRDPSTKLFARAAVRDWSYRIPSGYANVGRVLAVGDDVSSTS